jgi:thermitase
MRNHKQPAPLVAIIILLFFIFATPTIGRSRPINPGDFRISLSNGTISLDANRAHLGSILTELAKEENLQLKTEGMHDQLITITLRDVQLDSFIKRMFKNYALFEGKSVDGSAYRQLFVLSSNASEGEEQGSTAEARTEKDNIGLSAPPASGSFPSNADKPSSATAHGPSVDYMPNELMVRFDPTAKQDEIDALNKAFSGTVISKIDQLNVYRLGFPAGSDLRSIQSAYGSSPLTQTIEPNYLVHSPVVDMQDSQAGGEWELEKMRVSEAWDTTRGSSSVLIATLDTGIDPHHPDLSRQAVEGYNVLTRTAEIPIDDNGHGTQIAGIIAGAGNDGIGISGICPNCRILPIKVLDARGEGSYSNVIEGIIYAADHGASIINMSLGGYGYSKMLNDAVQYAYKKNVVLVAAAGNENTDVPCYPAALPNVLGVSATGPQDERWSEANYGSYIAVTAPGMGILAPTAGGGYAYGTGTSEAAAAVSGLSGLLKAQNPASTNAELSSRLEDSADDLGAPGRDEYFGAGRINAETAVSAAAER